MSNDVEAVNRGDAVAILDNGEQIAVALWLDCFGDECTADEAVVAVAGPNLSGQWFTIDLSAFEPTLLN